MSVKYYDWLDHHAGRRPEKLALHDLDTGRKFTYAQFNQRSGKLAAVLQSQGIQKGDRVAILAQNCPEYFEVQFACFKIGAIFVPLNWRLTLPELAFIAGDCEPKALVSDDFVRDVAAQLAKDCGIDAHLKIGEDGDYETALGAAGDFSRVETRHEDVCTIMYTSGTTGNPKGAMITHQMLFYNVMNLAMPASVDQYAVQLVVLPLFHTGGLNCYANPVIHSGGTLLLLRTFEPGRALEVIGDPAHGVTHFFAVPAPYQFMMQHPQFASTDFSRLRIAGVGGAPCAEAILCAWIDRGVELAQGWGMTETSPGGISLEPTDALRKVGSAGKPLLHTEVKIVDDDGEEITGEGVGELLIRGPNITPGYWNRPDATKDSFTDDWLKTGDAARRDSDGYYYIVDRWKDMYISGGENVYPAEVENVLYQLEEIAEVAVIGEPSEKWGESGLAIAVLKPGQSVTEEAVIEHCLGQLAKFKIPQRVLLRDEPLPRNATGKVLKRTLRDEYVGAEAPKIT